MKKKNKRPDQRDEIATKGDVDDSMEALKRELRDARADREEADEVTRRLREENQILVKENEWLRKALDQAGMFLVGITNTATLAGRGWRDTMKRLEEERPLHADRPEPKRFSVRASWAPAAQASPDGEGYWLAK